jgi:hypothetical protein
MLENARATLQACAQMPDSTSSRNKENEEHRLNACDEIVLVRQHTGTAAHACSSSPTWYPSAYAAAATGDSFCLNKVRTACVDHEHGWNSRVSGLSALTFELANGLTAMGVKQPSPHAVGMRTKRTEGARSVQTIGAEAAS